MKNNTPQRRRQRSCQQQGRMSSSVWNLKSQIMFSNFVSPPRNTLIKKKKWTPLVPSPFPVTQLRAGRSNRLQRHNQQLTTTNLTNKTLPLGRYPNGCLSATNIDEMLVGHGDAVTLPHDMSLTFNSLPKPALFVVHAIIGLQPY
jgi:hypothetical protein